MNWQFSICMWLLAVFSIFVCNGTAPASAGSESVPVMVGGSDMYDACSGVGEVTELDPNGDYYLSVRTGPGTKFKEIDRLPMGAAVFLCDEKGNWHGIVYPQGDCGVMTSIQTRQPYRGVCKSGWVYKKYIKVVAG